jgi:hypothetical protein
VETTDRYGRTVAKVFVGETDVNMALVKAGLAWHYKAFSNDAGLAKAEEEARGKLAGLWADKNPIPPWEFRKSGSDKKETQPAASSAQTETKYWLNTSSGVRHNSTCKNYRNTARGREATATEGKACGICGG